MLSTFSNTRANNNFQVTPGFFFQNINRMAEIGISQNEVYQLMESD